MSKESLDYQKLCSNYYSSLEDSCCMESCEFYNHNECPVVYVNGLLEKKDEEIALLEKALELAVKYYVNLNNCDFAESCWKTIIKYFKTKAKEMMSDNGEQV